MRLLQNMTQAKSFVSPVYRCKRESPSRRCIRMIRTNALVRRILRNVRVMRAVRQRVPQSLFFFLAPAEVYNPNSTQRL